MGKSGISSLEVEFNPFGPVGAAAWTCSSDVSAEKVLSIEGIEDGTDNKVCGLQIPVERENKEVKPV